jgi:DNA mismatch endonuclease (patch repair protein)
MAKVRQKGTGAEVALRRELYRRGLRYRVGFEVLKKPRRVADIVFPGLMIAIFVDGCFWHACPEHATWPKQNSEFWREKIEANRARDADTNERLRSIGWTVLRFWEHEPPTEAAEIVVQTVAMAKSKRCASSASSYKKTERKDGRPHGNHNRATEPDLSRSS